MSGFDIFVLILVAAALIKGYLSGLAMQLAMLTGLILGAVFAGKLSAIIAPKLIALFGGSPHIIGPLSYMTAFIAIIIGMLFVGKMLTSFIKAIHLSIPNKLAGAAFSCAKWLILFSILLNLLVEIDQGKHIIKESTRENSLTYSLVIDIAQTVIPYLRFDWII